MDGQKRSSEMVMALSLETAQERALAFMHKGYH